MPPWQDAFRAECRTCGGVKYMLGNCYPCPECKPPLICPHCITEEARRRQALKRIARRNAAQDRARDAHTRAEAHRNGRLLAKSRRR